MSNDNLNREWVTITESSSDTTWKLYDVRDGRTLRFSKYTPLEYVVKWLTGRVKDPAEFIAEYCPKLVEMATMYAMMTFWERDFFGINNYVQRPYKWMFDGEDYPI